MNTRDVHRHIENVNEITWYRADVPTADGGGGVVLAFVQADSEDAALAILNAHGAFPDLDVGAGRAKQISSSWDDIERRLEQDIGPDIAVGQDGDVTGRK